MIHNGLFLFQLDFSLSINQSIYSLTGNYIEMKLLKYYAVII